MKKHSIFRHIAGSLLIAAVAITGTTGIVKATAREASPFNYRFYFNGGEYQYDYSAPASKDNSSDSVAQYWRGESNVRMCVVGYDDAAGIIENIELQEVEFAPGERKQITNWIIENGLGQACLRGEPMDDSTIYAEGWWSPDLYN